MFVSSARVLSLVHNDLWIGGIGESSLWIIRSHILIRSIATNIVLVNWSWRLCWLQNLHVLSFSYDKWITHFLSSHWILPLGLHITFVYSFLRMNYITSLRVITIEILPLVRRILHTGLLDCTVSTIVYTILISNISLNSILLLLLNISLKISRFFS